MTILTVFFLAHLPFILTIAPPAFISNWLPIEAHGDPSLVERVVPHGLGGLPMKVQVQVRIQYNSEYIYFNALNSAQSGDYSGNYGGVIYMFNANEVKIIAPGPANCASCNGYVVYLGGNNFMGPANIPRMFKAGHVRVRAWDMCEFGKPSYLSSVTIDNVAPDNFQELDHQQNTLDMLIVHMHLNNGYVVHAEDSAAILTTDNPFGGVMFAYSRSKIRYWTPARGNGIHEANGVPFSAVNGWGNTGEFYNETGPVTAYLFGFLFNDFNSNPRSFKLEINKGPGTQDLPSFEATSDLDTDTFFTYLTMSPDEQLPDGNFGYQFMVPGSSLISDSAVSGPFGGLVFGHSHRTIYTWRPIDNSGGCIIAIGGLWGSGLMTECSTVSIVTAIGVDSVFIESVCEEKKCSAQNIGPVCDCGGNGFEGQFCSSPISCAAPSGHDPLTVSFSPSLTAYGFNDTVTYTCKSGYEPIDGSISRRCTHNKTWSDEPLTCERISCGNPDTVDPLSQITNITSIKFEGVVNYTCVSGYDIATGNSGRTCLANRTWSGSAPTCNVTCGSPVDYGGVKRLTFGNTIGNYANYTCAVGYENPNGSLSRYCKLDGDWDGEPPSCSIKYCVAPEQGEKSQLDFTTLHYWSIAYYTCQMGYVNVVDMASTTQKSVCGNNKIWSPAPLNCTRIQCPIPSVGNFIGNIPTDPRFYGDNITFQCIVGKMLGSGNLDRSCLADGSWSGDMPSCQDVVCPSLGNITKGTIITTGHIYGHQAIAVCDEGTAVMSGDMVRMCSQSGTWVGASGSDPVCQDVLHITFKLHGVSYIDNTDNYTYDTTNLLVDPTTLSKYRRSKNSVIYYYPSHIAIGTTGIVFLVAVVLYLCSLDLINLTYQVKQHLLGRKDSIKQPPQKVYNVYVNRK